MADTAVSKAADASLEESKVKALDMLGFINAAWTPYHAVEEASRRLLSAGFQHIAEKDAWNLKPGTTAAAGHFAKHIVAWACV